MIFMLFWITGLIFGIMTAIFTPSCRNISSIANNLLRGYAIAGFLCVWYPPMFKLAVSTPFTPLFIGAAFLHTKELRAKGNSNPGNVTSKLPDFLIPVTLIALPLPANIRRIPR